MGILDIIKGVVSGSGPAPGSGLSGELTGVVRGAAQGAMYGNPLGGAISGALSGHPVLQSLAPMLLSGGSLGLGGLLKRFHDHGHQEQAASWVAKGPNQPLTPDQVQEVLGSGMITKLATDSGKSPDEVKAELATSLPGLIDQLTPTGDLPTEDQLSELLAKVDPTKLASA